MRYLNISFLLRSQFVSCIYQFFFQFLLARLHIVYGGGASIVLLSGVCRSIFSIFLWAVVPEIKIDWSIVWFCR